MVRKTAVEQDEHLLDLLGLVVWKMRHNLSALEILITQDDRQAFHVSLEENDQFLQVNIDDHNGSTRIHLTDLKSGDRILATEHKIVDWDKCLF